MVKAPKISLVLADVDGTLVTEEKVLTKRAQAAVQRLHAAGIRFAITSGRPPKGMAMLFDELRLETPIAGFNGGLFVKRDLAIIEQKTLPNDVATKAIELIRQHGLDAWVYRGNDWLITKLDAPHVAREAWTVKFQPKVVADFDDELDDVAKIVGISDDLDKVRQCEADAQAAFGQRATATRSQPYYLDVTNKDANKGAVVDYLSQPPEHAGRRDRHPRRPAKRRADVQAIGLQHRDGQRVRSGQGAGQRHHGFLQRRGVRQGSRTFHSRLVGLRTIT